MPEWRRRESNPRPKAFRNDVYMHIRVVAGNPRPEAPFPLSVPRRINPANRGSVPIPGAHRRLGKTAGKAHLVDVLSRPAGVVRKDVA